jgi:mono/diheme cytochrome c family protein
MRSIPPALAGIAALAALAALGTPGAAAHAQGAAAPTRGELLYATHCIACHTTQMHWRDERRAKDWESLKAQVRRWQATAGLQWSDADIAEVARHLNQTIYHYAQPYDRVSRLDLPTR